MRAANANVSSVVDTEYENKWWGLLGLVDDGTYRASYFGQTRADVDALNAYVRSGTAALSADVMQQTVDLVDEKLGGSIDCMICHYNIRRAVTALTNNAQRRYYGADLMKPDPGTQTARQKDQYWGGIKIKVVRDFPIDMMMFLDTAGCGLKEYVSGCRAKWDDTDGSRSCTAMARVRVLVKPTRRSTSSASSSTCKCLRSVRVLMI